jgi:hypothetical protein
MNDLINAALAKSPTLAACRTKTGKQIHAMHVSGQGPTYCGVRRPSIVDATKLTAFAHPCEKCFNVEKSPAIIRNY